MENKNNLKDLKIRLLKESSKKRRIKREIARILTNKHKEDLKK